MNKTNMNKTNMNKSPGFKQTNLELSSPLVLLPAYPVQLSGLECVLVMLLVGAKTLIGNH